MKKAFLVFILTAVCMSSVGQKVIDLSGVWDFRIDRGDVGVAQEWFGSGVSMMRTLSINKTPGNPLGA